MTKSVKWEVETRMNGGRTYAAIYSTLPGVETPPGSYPLLIARCQDERDAELIVRAVSALSQPEEPGRAPDCPIGRCFGFCGGHDPVRPQPEEEPGRPRVSTADWEAITTLARADALQEAAKLVRGMAFKGDSATAVMMTRVFEEIATKIEGLAEAKRGSGG